MLLASGLRVYLGVVQGLGGLRGLGDLAGRTALVCEQGALKPQNSQTNPKTSAALSAEMGSHSKRRPNYLLPKSPRQPGSVGPSQEAETLNPEPQTLTPKP